MTNTSERASAKSSSADRVGSMLQDEETDFPSSYNFFSESGSNAENKMKKGRGAVDHEGAYFLRSKMLPPKLDIAVCCACEPTVNEIMTFGAIFAMLPTTMLHLILDSMLYCRRPTQAALPSATLLQKDLSFSVSCSIVFRGAAVFAIRCSSVKLGS